MALFSTRSYPTWTIIQSSHFLQLSIAQNLILQFNAQRNKLLYTRILFVFFVWLLNWIGLVFLMKYISFRDTYYRLGLVTLCKRCTYLSIWIYTKIAIWNLTLKSLNTLTLLKSTSKSNRWLIFILTQLNIFHQIICHQEETLSMLVVSLTATTPVIKSRVVIDMLLYFTVINLP